MEQEQFNALFQYLQGSFIESMLANLPGFTEDILEKYRKEGNELYQKSDFYKALIAYNKVLASAPPDYQHLGLVYANRSAVYFKTEHYEEFLENLELARENRCPQKKFRRLDVLEKKAKELLIKGKKRANFDPLCIFKLSHSPNEKIPFIVSCLELREDEKFGRHIVTSQNLKAGDILAIEEPLFKFMLPGGLHKRCQTCLKSNKLNLKPSFKEHGTIYCSRECEENDINPELDDLLVPSVLPILFHTSLRIAGGVDDLIALFKQEEQNKKTVFDFDLTNPDDPLYMKNLLIAAWSLSKNVRGVTQEVSNEQLLNIPEIKAQPRTAVEEGILMRIILGLMGIYNTNACTMNEYFTENSKAQKSYFAKGILPFGSLINHACYPNVILVSVDNKIATIACRPIKAGEQIFRCYVDDVATNIKSHLEPYEFDCECIVCTGNFASMYHFPQKIPNFEPPEHKPWEPKEAMKQLKTNCRYIEKHAKKQPCVEISLLIEYNIFLLHCIAAQEHLFK